MPGRRRQRAVLPPAGHATVDETRIRPERVVGAKSQPLHHTRPKSFDQHVGFADQLQRQLHIGGRLQIQRNRSPPPRGYVELAHAASARPVDPHHVGAHVREHHAAERPWPDPREFNDFNAVQRSRAHISSSFNLAGFNSAECGRYSRLESPPRHGALILANCRP